MAPSLRKCPSLTAGLLGMGPILLSLLTAVPTPAAEVKAARVDALGDPLPPGALARLGTLRLRHQGCVVGTDFSPDGKLLASAGLSFEVRLWDTASGREVPRIPPVPLTPFQSVKFSPTGKILAAGTYGYDPDLYLWDTATGKLLHRLQITAHTELVDMAFTDGSKSLLGVDSRGRVRWWSVAGGAKLREWDLKGSLETPPGSWVFKELESGSLTPDGRVLAAVVRWVNAHEKVERKELFRLVVGDLDRRKLRWQMERKEGDAPAFALSADGKVVAVAAGKADISLRDGASGRELRRLPGGEGERNSWEGLVFSADGKLLAAIGHGPEGVRVWEVGSGKVVHQLGRAIVSDPTADLCRPLFSPDGKRLLFPWDDALALWDLSPWAERPRLPGHRGAVHFLSFSDDGKKLLSGSAGAEPQWPCPREVITWDTASWREVARSEDAEEKRLLFRSRDHRLGIVHDHGDCFLVGLPAGRRLRKLRDIHAYPDLARHGFFSAGGRIAVQALARSDKRDLALVDVATGKRRGTLPEAAVGICLAFAPDERTLAWVDTEAVIHVVAVDGCKELCRLSKPRRRWEYQLSRPLLAFSPDGSQLAFWEPESKAIVLWDWQTGREQGRIREGKPLTNLTSLAYSSDGRMLAAGLMNYDVELWEVASAQRRRCLEGHGGPVSALAFSPDGRLLASGSDDTTVLVWKLHGQAPREKPAPAQLEVLWAELAHADAGKAYEAMTALLQHPSAAGALLGQKLEPGSAVDAGTIARLIADLDNDDFARRERATRALEGLAEQAEPALRKTLQEQPSVEVRRRITGLLDRLRQPPPGCLRIVRAVEVLEQLHTPQAQEVLKRLAGGAADARLTREARASLQRLERKAAVKLESR